MNQKKGRLQKAVNTMVNRLNFPFAKLKKIFYIVSNLLINQPYRKVAYNALILKYKKEVS